MGIGSALSSFFGGMFGRGSSAASGAAPLMPIPRNQGEWNQTLTGLFGPPGLSNPTRDNFVSDVYNGPYRGPLDLDRYGGETPESRRAYRDEYSKSPVLRGAWNGLRDDLAVLEPTIVSGNKKNPVANDAAEFVKWTVAAAPGGWPGLINHTFLPGAIDGFSVLEKKLKPINWKGQHKWGLAHVRSLDTIHVRLQLDSYRNVIGVVNMVRGLEYFPPDQYLIYTHNGMYNNPFGQSDGRAALDAARDIADVYKLWYIALKVYGLPYMKGKTNSTNKAEMAKALTALRAGGWAVLTNKDDDIELLNLAAGAALNGFEPYIHTKREDIFFATRNVAQPFMEGDGGVNAHTDTGTQQDSSNAGEKFKAHNIVEVYKAQLIPWLVHPNFDLEEWEYPQAKLGGTDWNQNQKIIATIKEAREAGLDPSKKWAQAQIAMEGAVSDDDRLVSPQERQQQAQQQQQQMLAQPGATTDPTAVGDPNQPASEPGGELEPDATGVQDEAVAAALDALGVDGSDDTSDTSAFSQDFGSGRAPGTGPPPFPGAVFDRSRHRWVRGHRPDDDDAPAPQYPSRVNPGITYGNQDDRDSDDRHFRGHQQKLDRANADVERIRAQLAVAEKRDPAQDPKVKALRAQMDALNARAAQLRAPQQQPSPQSAQAAAAAIQKIPPEKQEAAAQRIRVKASSPEGKAILARADQWADAQAAKHAARVAKHLGIDEATARNVLASTIKMLCRKALQGEAASQSYKGASGRTLNIGVNRKQFSDGASPVRWIATSRLSADPERFQFRTGADADDGTVRELPDEEFDPRQRSTPFFAWHDPEDGEDYVVDGHHGLAWAERDGVKRIPVRFIEADSAEEAREYGRRANVSARSGTAAGAGDKTFSADHQTTRAGELVSAEQVDRVVGQLLEELLV